MYEPSPEEIEAKCSEFRSGWSEVERRWRAGYTWNEPNRPPPEPRIREYWIDELFPRYVGKSVGDY